MSTDVTVYQSASLADRKSYAQTLASAADLIPKGLWAVSKDANGNNVNAPSPGKILLVAETGAMLGLHPMAALQGIDVIEGKATISPQLMTGLLRAAGHKVRIKSSGTVTGGDYKVTVTLIRSDDPDEPFESTWDIDRAARAGLCTYNYDATAGKWSVRARSQSGKVLPWESYPETMCKWRAIAEVGREGGDDVLKGISYTPEEMGAIVTEEGDIEAPAEPSTDWAALAGKATSKEALDQIRRDATTAGEYTDAVRIAVLTRAGAIGRGEVDEDVVDAEVVEATPEEATEVETLRTKLSGDRDPAEPTDAEYADMEEGAEA